MRKGIILAGGSGTRLFPLTLGLSKQLLPIYDKPTFYYALSTLMLADLREIYLVTNPEFIDIYKKYFGDGHELGIEIKYIPQIRPNGIAEVFLLLENELRGHSSALILGDNIFYGNEFISDLKKSASYEKGATLFTQIVSNPCDYGVIKYDAGGYISDIVEKPAVAPSNEAVTGLYFYDELVTDYAKSLTPSARGELEITDLNKLYLNDNEVTVNKFGRGTAWFDTGSPYDLLRAASFIEIVQNRSNLLIGSPEEISFRKGWIDACSLSTLAHRYHKTKYGQYLMNLATIE